MEELPGEEGSGMWRSCSDAWPALGLVQGLEEGLGTGLGPGRTLPGGSQVVTVDVRNKKAVFKDGFKLEYSKLLLAPGSRWEGPPRGWELGAQGARRPLPTPAHLSPKTLSCKGKEVENVFTIRTPEDANRVVRLARGRNAVVVGAGFLGEQLGMVGPGPGWHWPREVQGASPPPPPQGWRWPPT